ncbi:ADP-ribosylglycohydrolase family protein [Acetivibrio mesophilus]|uniref:ADP-ribosylglycohydrolase family protein n=1 Tax=Acetivibrio mesophilus TaxID=2487273 RepID=A0A4Q0I5L8_9FIRM|nr:ADP-ribosylglycohydrolase family protein [Acetivibrio mesophilus]RXE59591.1 ADP-ribosylglycohydrolase family protein [Acetivibrio mesophilus]HHV30514.1 ADP-ribosylglycohydrolase family protein [Clostridium sp.]
MKEIILGSIMGTAVGDSLGLLYEGLSSKRQRKLYKNINSQKFFMGKGFISDDTEHTLMVAHALYHSSGDEEIFSRYLARSLRKWIISMPLGIGFASLRACIKLLVGFPPEKSGVFSAGNGPAMRSALIGIICGNDIQKMKSLVRISTRITHTDPKAEIGALTVAYAAFIAGTKKEVAPSSFYEGLKSLLIGYESLEFLKIVEEVVDSVYNNESTREYVERLGLKNGVSGYIYHTVPVVIHAWLSYKGNFRKSIIEMIECGGDTDTTAAILGGILGASATVAGIPEELQENIYLFPYSKKYIENISHALAYKNKRTSEIQVKEPFWGLSLIRNLIFIPVIAFHVIRRMLPPY